MADGSWYLACWQGLAAGCLGLRCRSKVFGSSWSQPGCSQRIKVRRGRGLSVKVRWCGVGGGQGCAHSGRSSPRSKKNDESSWCSRERTRHGCNSSKKSQLCPSSRALTRGSTRQLSCWQKRATKSRNRKRGCSRRLSRQRWRRPGGAGAYHAGSGRWRWGLREGGGCGHAQHSARGSNAFCRRFLPCDTRESSRERREACCSWWLALSRAQAGRPRRPTGSVGPSTSLNGPIKKWLPEACNADFLLAQQVHLAKDALEAEEAGRAPCLRSSGRRSIASGSPPSRRRAAREARG